MPVRDAGREHLRNEGRVCARSGNAGREQGRPEITLEGDEITILGRRAAEPVNGEVLFRERSAADYRRVFELDPAVDTGKIPAKMEQGMLRLTLLKSERVKPRKITVSD